MFGFLKKSADKPADQHAAAATGDQTNAPGLITTQLVFTATSVFGIYRWLVVAQKETAKH